MCLLKFGEYDVRAKRRPSWVKGVERKVQKSDMLALDR